MLLVQYLLTGSAQFLISKWLYLIERSLQLIKSGKRSNEQNILWILDTNGNTDIRSPKQNSVSLD